MGGREKRPAADGGGKVGAEEITKKTQVHYLFGTKFLTFIYLIIFILNFIFVKDMWHFLVMTHGILLV
jgi:uncharacterized protein YqhQ